MKGCKKKWLKVERREVRPVAYRCRCCSSLLLKLHVATSTSSFSSHFCSNPPFISHFHPSIYPLFVPDASTAFLPFSSLVDEFFYRPEFLQQ